MKWPIDGTDLAMTERQGVEIDYCPKRHGVWLDRGELDKVIEALRGHAAPAASGTAAGCGLSDPPRARLRAAAPQEAEVLARRPVRFRLNVGAASADRHAPLR